MYGVGFQYEKVSQLVPFLFYLFANLLFLPGVCIRVYKDKKKHCDFQNCSDISARHSDVKWHSSSLSSLENVISSCFWQSIGSSALIAGFYSAVSSLIMIKIWIDMSLLKIIISELRQYIF